MVAAAVIGGVVLLSLPFVVASSTGGDGPKRNSGNNAAGYTDPAPDADGYVPQADASKGPLGKGSPKAPGGTAGTTGGVNAPPIIEAASADNVGGSGGLATDTKAGDKAPKGKTGDTTTQTKTGDKTTQAKTGSAPAKQTETKTDPSTGNSPATTPQKPAPASPTVLFSAVGGLHCTNSAVTFTERGKYTDGQKGWTTHDGSYAAGGCNGWYRSIPMSGDSNDSDNSAVWNFRTGNVSSGSCKVSVYIPNDSNIGHVGGQPTYYTVHDGTSTAGSTQLGHFSITQVSHRGQWIAAPSYKINSGVLSVKLHDRGDDWSSSSRVNAHNAAAPIQVECTK
jgi:translation initiation factor IF-2